MRVPWLLIGALFALLPTIGFGGPAEDVASVINLWADAFNSNDVDSLVGLYAPDAIVIGTAGSQLIEGRDAVHSYFSRLAQSGDKVAVESLRVIPARDDIAYATGFYTFSGVRKGEIRKARAGFTMVLVKRGNKWLIAHHHSSRRSGSLPAVRPLRRG
jgi:uncharacterized protein (TIGR02246 family)